MKTFKPTEHRENQQSDKCAQHCKVLSLDCNNPALNYQLSVATPATTTKPAATISNQQCTTCKCNGTTSNNPSSATIHATTTLPKHVTTAIPTRELIATSSLPETEAWL
jgi:hypothetical protein